MGLISVETMGNRPENGVNHGRKTDGQKAFKRAWPGPPPCSTWPSPSTMYQNSSLEMCFICKIYLIY